MATALRGAWIGTTALVFAAAFVPSLRAQEAPADSAARWMTEATGQLSFAQASFRNWQEGGVNTLALSSGLNAKASRTSNRWQQTHEMRLAFGFVKQDTLDFRKAEDLIQFLSAFQYQGTGFFERFNPTFATSLRTQFAEGFNYNEDPLGQDRTLPANVSAFFAPATLTQSIGLTYKPLEWLTQRFGVAMKETVVTIERFRVLYGVDPEDAVRFEAGMESFTELDKEIFENVRYKARLSLFASFNTPKQPDALWENLITMKVNPWLNVSFEFVTLYDLDITSEVQLKEVLSVGISFILL